MSIKGERLAFKTAKMLADKLEKFFSKWGKVTIVGSIRRLEDDIGDIDLVIVPFKKDLQVIDLIRSLPKDEVEHIQGYRHMTIARYKSDGYIIPINIWISDKESEGAAIMAYTGPKGSTIGIRKVAGRMGFLLNEKGLYKGDEKIAGRTEEEIYTAMGRPWKAPELRGK